MTQAEFDRLTISTAQMCLLLGVTKQNVGEHVKAGHLRRVGRGQFPLVESLQVYTAHLRKMAAARGGPDAADVKAQRARVLKLQGDRLQAAIAKESGEVITLAEVEAELREYVDIFRRAVDQLPGRVCGQLGLDRKTKVALHERLTVEWNAIVDEHCAALVTW